MVPEDVHAELVDVTVGTLASSDIDAVSLQELAERSVEATVARLEPVGWMVDGEFSTEQPSSVPDGAAVEQVYRVQRQGT